MRKYIEVAQMDITGRCNAQCIFCGAPRNDRVMPVELYESCLNQLAEYKPEYFMPMIFGEPFCHPEAIDLIKMAHSILKMTNISVYTNASLITPEQIKELAKLNRFEFVISVNGGVPSTREKLMGLKDFDVVMEKIELIDSLNMKYQTTMIMHPTVSYDEIIAFNNRFNGKGNVMVWDNWAGHLYSYKRRNSFCCPKMAKTVNIDVDGRVILCCQDCGGNVIFGDMKEQSLDEILSGELHQEYYTKHLRLEGQTLFPCNQCSFRAVVEE